MSINYTYRSLKVELFQPKYFHKHCLFASIQNTFLDKYYYKTNKLYLWFFLMVNLDAVKLYAFSILFYSSAEHKFIQLKLVYQLKILPSWDFSKHTWELPLLELTNFLSRIEMNENNFTIENKQN